MVQSYIFMVIMILVIMKIMRIICSYFSVTFLRLHNRNTIMLNWNWLEKLLYSTLVIINLAQLRIDWNFFFIYDMLHILFLIVYQNILRPNNVLSIRIWISAHHCSSIKCSTCREFWHDEYWCPSKIPNTDMPAPRV